MTDDVLPRARALLALGRPRDAETLLRTHLATAPDDAPAIAELARSVLAQDRLRDALDAASEAVRLSPESADAFVVLAETYRLRGARTEALSAASSAVALAPENWVTHYVRGLARLMAPAKPRAALEDAERARELAPESSSVHVLIGMCHGARGWHSAEREAYVEALHLDPSDVMAMNNLAALELNRGRLDFAGSHLRSGLATDPSERVLRHNFDTLLLRILWRLWLALIALGFAASLVLSSEGAWWQRAALGTAGLLLAGLMLARAIRRLPRRVADIARGLWRRGAWDRRFVLVLWLVTGTAAMLVAFAPRSVALPAQYFVGYGFFLGVIAVAVEFIQRASRRVGEFLRRR